MSAATLSATERAVLAAVQDGLPLVAQPYAAVGDRLGLAEDAVIAALASLEAKGVSKRFGLVVRHRELGYRANAMVVFQVPAGEVDAVGAALAQLPYVTLCYQRRTTERWPFNLYCMIHGTDRATVLQQIEAARAAAGIAALPHRVLFSRRRFKQCGGRYVAAPGTGAAAATAAPADVRAAGANAPTERVA